MAKVYDTATDLITFARSSSGTALRRVGYGDELVDTANTASSWQAYGSNTVEQDGDAVKITHVDHDSGGFEFLSAAHGTSQDLVEGKVYKMTLKAKVSAGAAVIVRLFGLSTILKGIVVSSDTYVDLEYIFVGQASHLINTPGMASGEIVWLKDISVKEVIFDRATDPLVLFNHPDDIPRIEYAADGSLKGLLIEEARTNLLTHSEDFSQSYWTKETGVSIDSTLVTGPDGTLSGRRVLGFGSASGVRLSSTVNITNSTISSSIWVKGEGSDIGKDIRLATRGDGGTFVGSNIDHTLTADWVRIDVSFTQFADNTGVFFSLRRPDTNPASEVLIYGAQLEQGSFATSYIPTSGSQSTRSPDIASIPVSAFGYNQSAGTVVVEASAPTTDANYGAVSIDDGTNNNRIQVFAESTADVRFQIVDGGAHQGNIDLGTTSPSTPFRSAATIVENDMAHSVDGSVVGTDTTCTIPSVYTVRLGSLVGSNYLNGHIKSLSYFPRRLTDAQLQELTS